MEYFSIASGSSGNCICIGSDRTHILVDAGISGKRIEAGLNDMDLSARDLSAVLITHEHADHISGLGVLARRYGLPIYATPKTLDAIMMCKSIGSIDPGLLREVVPDEDFSIGDITVSAMRTKHDAADPVAYVTRTKSDAGTEKRIAVVTDLGCYDDYILSHLQKLDAILLEANHDINMLLAGGYPYPLKQRILGDFGHLSNERSGQLLSDILHDDMKHIFLGHLSQENNVPELAYETVRLEVTLADNPYRGSDFPIEIAKRGEPSRRIEI